MDIIALFHGGCPNIGKLILPGRRYYALPRVRGWLMICTWPEYDVACWN